jgi:hypothetical protein
MFCRFDTSTAQYIWDRFSLSLSPTCCIANAFIYLPPSPKLKLLASSVLTRDDGCVIQNTIQLQVTITIQVSTSFTIILTLVIIETK